MVTPLSKTKQNQGIKRPHGIPNPVWKRLYTLKEAAEYLGRSEWGMRELIWAGKIPVVRPGGGRKIFVDIEDLNGFITQNKSVYL
jgi:excisionase family DNA binding protein